MKLFILPDAWCSGDSMSLLNWSEISPRLSPSTPVLIVDSTSLELLRDSYLVDVV